MKSSAKHAKLTSVDDLFSTEEGRAGTEREKVVQVPLSDLHPFVNHPFRVVNDEKMQETAESIRENGVLVPAIVRPREEGGYELVSGHRRHFASQLAGLETMPVIIRDLDDNAATIIMVDSNIQRETLLPSERAFALKMKLDAIKRQGSRTDLTSTQIAEKLSAEKVGDDAGLSKDQVRRYIRLTELIPELLAKVDNKEIGFTPAVELSFLTTDEQVLLLDAMDAVSGDVLAGAVFAVCDETGNTVAELTTGEDGTATTDWLPYGTYTVTEISAPAGFANSSTALQIDAFEDGRTYIIEVENTPTVGGIKVIKVDSLTQMPIAGVQFDVYQGSTLIGSMTTNDQGVAFIDGIEKGTYTVKEHALPTGYVGELAEMTVTVEACSVAEAIAVNTPAQSKIRIIKTDSVTGGMLPGAEFSVADVAGNIVAELTTGEDGTAESGWLPYGTYFVSEVSAPDGYH